MGFNRGEIRVKATNISVMNRKGGKSILGCRVMSGTITATMSDRSHLDGRVRDASRDSSHPTMPGTIFPAPHFDLFQFYFIFLVFFPDFSFTLVFNRFSYISPRHLYPVP